MNEVIGDVRGLAASLPVTLATLVRVFSIPTITDERGVLYPLEFADIGFVPVRSFFIDEVPAGTIRGGHGHHTATQLLLCLSGKIRVDLRHGEETASLTLEGAGDAVLIGPRVWSRQIYLGTGTRLLVFCDEPYDAESYFCEDD